MSDPPADTRLRCRRLVRTALLVLLVACGIDPDSRVADARAQRAAGELESAVATLRAALADAPDHPEANFLLGVVLFEGGQLNRAVFPLEKAASDPRRAVHANLLLARIGIQAENFEESERASGRLLELDPENLEALWLRARARLAAGDQEGALADAERRLAIEPDHYDSVLLTAAVLADLDRLDDAEEAHRRLEELAARSEQPGLAGRACAAYAQFLETARADPERAAARYEECLAADPANQVALRLGTDLLERRGSGERARELWASAVRERPEDPALRAGWVARLEGAGDLEAAEEALRAATEVSQFGPAWRQLGAFYRRTGRPEQALEAMTRAAELGPASLGLERAEVLVDLGNFDAAEALTETLSDPAERDLVRARLALARGDAAGALASAEASIERWPNNPSGRMLAALAARALGDTDRAIAELREAVRMRDVSSEAGLLFSRVLFERGEFAEARRVALGYLQNRDPRNLDAHLIAARAARKLGDPEGARGLLEQGLRYSPVAPHLLAEQASLVRELEGPRASLELLEGSGIDLSDPVNEPVLRVRAEALAAAERSVEALDDVSAALAAHPERASLHQLRGALLAGAGRDPEARTAYEGALRLDPGNASAHAGLAALAVNSGDFAGAVAHYDAAALADGGDPEAPYAAAQWVLAAGRSEDAAERLARLVNRQPGHARAASDLAWILAERGTELDRALALAERAADRDPRPEILDTLGWVHLKRGDAEAARGVLERAVAALPEAPLLQYHLALAQRDTGQREAAIASLKQALALGRFPEEDEARDALAEMTAPPA